MVTNYPARIRLILHFTGKRVGTWPRFPYNAPLQSLEQATHFKRRHFLGQAGRGLGGLALTSLLQPGLLPAHGGGLVHPLHVAPRAKRVIFLCMAGGPSHLESFD